MWLSLTVSWNLIYSRIQLIAPHWDTIYLVIITSLKNDCAIQFTRQMFVQKNIFGTLFFTKHKECCNRVQMYINTRHLVWLIRLDCIKGLVFYLFSPNKQLIWLTSGPTIWIELKFFTAFKKLVKLCPLVLSIFYTSILLFQSLVLL